MAEARLRINVIITTDTYEEAWAAGEEIREKIRAALPEHTWYDIEQSVEGNKE